jgi:bacterioferritin
MPQGNPQVIESLQSSLRLHWAAIEAYLSQSVHFATYGYPKLAAKLAHEADDETDHAKRLLERLEFFNVTPDVDHDPAVWPRHDFPGVLDANYEMETQAATVERSGYTIALASDDPLTADVFRQNLASSEASLIEIEAIQEMIGQIGLDNYLANLT